MTHRLATARSTEAIQRCRTLAIVTLAATAALMRLPLAPTADAAESREGPERISEAAAPRRAGEPIMAIVSLASQQVTVYDADGWTLRAPVSSGTAGRETPSGVFSVVEKDKDHHSNLYDDASMPNMERITWSGIALHGGPLPGYAASHGCVRMPYDFAETLFDKTQIGMRVIIAPNDAEPVPFSDPALFVPNAKALADAPKRAETLAREAADAASVADRAKSTATNAARAGAALAKSVPKLRALKTRADATLVFAERLLATAKTERATVRAQDLKEKAAAEVAERAAQIDSAKADAKTKLDAAKVAEEAAEAAKAKMADSAKAAHEAKLELEPVSVFISRATERLYVRRGFGAYLEAPVSIRNPDKPIGTHVFTAVARTDDGGLRWTAVTIEVDDNARDALHRVTIPQDVLDRIAPTALPRSSIIISDEPLNRETNYRTEFVVVLNNQPQGGLVMRERPESDRVADRRSWNGSFFGFGHWGGSDSSAYQRGAQNYYRRQW